MNDQLKSELTGEERLAAIRSLRGFDGSIETFARMHSLTDAATQEFLKALIREPSGIKPKKYLLHEEPNSITTAAVCKTERGGNEKVDSGSGIGWCWDVKISGFWTVTVCKDGHIRVDIGSIEYSGIFVKEKRDIYMDLIGTNKEGDIVWLWGTRRRKLTLDEQRDWRKTWRSNSLKKAWGDIEFWYPKFST